MPYGAQSVIFSFLITFLLLLPCQAQRVTFSNLPPTPRTVQATCIRGQSIEIPLRVTNRIPTNIHYTIAEPPSYATLSSPHVQTLTASGTIYTHDGTRGHKKDSFTFSAQFGTTGKPSAPALVEISIVEAPLRLTAPEEIDFGPTPVGTTGIKKIKISNPGGGDGSFRLECSPPWALPRGKIAHIYSDDTLTIPLTYSPAHLEADTGTLRIISGENVHPVSLSGNGVHPFSVTAVPDSPDEWNLTNLTNDNLVVLLDAPSGINYPASITLPGKVSVPVVIRRNPEWRNPITGSLTYSVKSAEIKFPINMPGEPPKISITPEFLDFGETDYGNKATAHLSITNSGGNIAYVLADLPPDITISPTPGSAPLRPGETMRWQVTLQASEKSGGYFSLHTSDNDRVSVQWTASIRPPSHPLPPVIEDGVPLPSSEEKTTVQNDWHVPPPASLRPTYISSDTIQISWSDPLQNSHQYRVEYLVAFDSENPEIWLPWEISSLVRENTEVRATFTSLAPDTVRTLRVLAFDTGGRSSVPSPVLRVATTSVQISKFYIDPGWFLLAFLILLSTFLIIATLRK